jgi:hypothetical protein
LEARYSGNFGKEEEEKARSKHGIQGGKKRPPSQREAALGKTRRTGLLDKTTSSIDAARDPGHETELAGTINHDSISGGPEAPTWSWTRTAWQSSAAAKMMQRSCADGTMKTSVMSVSSRTRYWTFLSSLVRLRRTEQTSMRIAWP